MLCNRDTTTTKGQNHEDDDMIRFQLETLLAEKACLAGENEVYARKNHFLREIVEYHQLTMQDVVYLDDGIAEVPEVYDSSSRVSRITSFQPITVRITSSSGYSELRKFTYSPKRDVNCDRER